MSIAFFLPETHEDASVQFDRQRALRYKQVALERFSAMLDAAIDAERRVAVQLVVPDGSNTEFAVTMTTCEDAEREMRDYGAAFGRKIHMQRIGVC
ncbi:MAG: hypothetical protein ACHP7J_00005 [Terriglobales bacterium]